jgi:LPS-assembly protein
MARRIASAALLASALSLPARPQSLQPFAALAGPADAPIEIDADVMTYGYDRKVLHLDGHVVARRGSGILRAGSGLYDRENGKLTLTGGVLGVQGRQVFLADAAFVDLNARTAELVGGKEQGGMAVLYLKELPANPDNPKAGKNALILHGRTVQQRADGGYSAQNIVLTPCDCVGEPDYELLADEARLEGDRAHLSGTHIHFPHVTLPLFPLSLPLTNRQWGLLAPQFGFSNVGGFVFSQPVFLPLGDSYDLTLTPGFFTGGTNAAATTPAKLGETLQYPAAIGARNIKGPRMGIEWRYAPVEGTSGSIGLDLFYDLDQYQSLAAIDPPVGGATPASPGRGLDGLRGVAHLLHRSEGEAGTFAVQGTVATDVMAVPDAEPTSVDRWADNLRTDVGFWRARGATTLGLDATFLQDVKVPDANEPDRRLFGDERRSTFQRLPALFAQVAPIPVGPMTFSLEMGAVHFAPFAGPDANEMSTGFAPTDQGAQLSQPLNAGDVARSQTVRGDIAPRLTWAAPASFPVDLRLQAGGRADGYVAIDHPDRDHARAYLDVDALIALPLERRFGATLHRIEPRFELRGITPSMQSGGPPIGDPADAGGAQYASAINRAQQNLAPCVVPAGSAPGACSATATNPIFGVPSARRPFDEIDGAAPSTGAVEAVFGLDQSLWRKTGKTATRWLGLNLTQDVLLGSGGGGGRVGEGSAMASYVGTFAAASAVLRYDWDLRVISAIIANLSAHDARYDEVHGGLTFLRGSSSERLRAGIDELFAAAKLNALAGSLTGSLGGGASAPLPANLRLGYEVSRYLSPDQPVPAGQANFTHTFNLTYDTPCHCATIGLGVAFLFHDTTRIGAPNVRFVLDLKSLGSFATF